MTPSSRSQPESGGLALLRDLAATPRPTGSEAIAKARERCARELREMGFEVTERPFEYSQFPGRFGTPLFGAINALVVGSLALGAPERLNVRSIIVVALIVLAMSGGRWLATDGVVDAPLLRARGVNLQATRGRDPRVWLSAHLDTKSQPIPSLVRVGAVLLQLVGFLVAAVLTFFRLRSVAPEALWLFAGIVTLIGAIPLMLSFVGTRSPGALDNASGVVTVLQAARELAGIDVGVVITDAEELGLAGARAWARRTPDGLALNCDGVDDLGVIQVMHGSSRPESLLASVQRASQTTGIACEVGRGIPGVLTDSSALSAEGFESVTFMRGTWRSLARVHSQRDDVTRLSGAGIPQTAALIVATVRDLLR